MFAQREIGRGKQGRQALLLDDIALVPSRRTRDPDAVSLHWRIDAFTFEFPFLVAPMDAVVDPAVAVAVGRLGGVAVLDLEGLWSRYEDPSSVLAEVRGMDPAAGNGVLQRSYAAPVVPGLIQQRIAQIRAAGVTVAGALSPAGVVEHWDAIRATPPDLLVIRGTTVSAEHVADHGAELVAHDRQQGPVLNLKRFVYDAEVPVIVGGCASYQAALHLMRTGAAGVLVGFGGGASHTTADVLGIRVPMATAIGDVAAARRDYLDESQGRYVHVIADGGIGRTGDVAKALAVGADAVMLGSPLARATGAPGGGRLWGREAAHPVLPRGSVVDFAAVGTLAEVLIGPSNRADGTMNFAGALRRAMALTGYRDLKEFQRCEVTVG